MKTISTMLVMRMVRALIKAELIMSHLPPAYCKPTVLAELREVLAEFLEVRP